MSDDFDEVSRLLGVLSEAAVRVLDGNSDVLGQLVGHIQVAHPELLPHLLMLAMIDLAMLRDIARTLAADIALYEGTPVEAVFERYKEAFLA